MVKNPQKELDEFRNQWKNEIKGSETSSNNNNIELSDVVNNLSENVVSQLSLGTRIDSNDDEQKATSLFLQGAELERRGKVFEAIRLYRRSIQLVPDIEKKIYERNKTNLQGRADEMVASDVNKNENLFETSNDDDGNDIEDLTDVNLLLRFQLFLEKSGQICKRMGSDKVLLTTGAHFCDLPTEIILLIFRWVVSNDLDVRSLDKCSEVCKGFYVCARDSEIWRAICVK